MVTVSAYDPAWPAQYGHRHAVADDRAAAASSCRFRSAPAAQVGVAYQLPPTITGALGSATWSIVSGALPQA